MTYDLMRLICLVSMASSMCGGDQVRSTKISVSCLQSSVCNIHTTDDGRRSDRKYSGNNYSWEFHQPIPAGYHKINVATGKDIYKNV